MKLHLTALKLPETKPKRAAIGFTLHQKVPLIKIKTEVHIPSCRRAQFQL